MDKYVPAIMDFFGTERYNLHFIVLKDADYSKPADLLAKYYDGMSRIQKTKKNLAGITIRQEQVDYTISMISVSDDRFSFHFHFVFIPQSLEETIVAKSLERIRSLTRCGTTIVSKDPHKALNDIAHQLEFDDKEALIRHSVKEKWFSDEDWYTNLLSSIKQLNS